MRGLPRVSPVHQSQPLVPAEKQKPGSSPAANQVVQPIRDLLWKEVGIVRTASGLKRAIHELWRLRECLTPPGNRAACEAVNLHQVALLIARSALAREESRGAHYRTDYPSHNDAKFQKHSIAGADQVRFE